MFDRSKLTTKEMDTLNRAYVIIATCGGEVWTKRYEALTALPQELKDELKEECK